MSKCTLAIEEPPVVVALKTFAAPRSHRLTGDHLVTYHPGAMSDDDRVFKALADPTRRTCSTGSSSVTAAR